MEEKEYLIKIARLYYEKGLTQNAIAEKLNTSRISVSRSLKKCLDQKIVTITINYQEGFEGLQNRIKSLYGLKDVIIVPYDEDSSTQYKLLAKGLGNKFYHFVKKDAIVGIGWGHTLSYLPESIPKESQSNATFLPLMGGYDNTLYKTHANYIASEIAKRVNGNFQPFYAPAVVENIQLKKDLLKEKQIQEVFETFDKIDTAIIGIGYLKDHDASVFKSGYFSESDLLDLKNSNAVCDVISCVYLNEKGEKCEVGLLDRTIGISEAALSKIKTKIAIFGGHNKSEAAKIAINSKYVDILVTDEETGHLLVGDPVSEDIPC